MYKHGMLLIIFLISVTEYFIKATQEKVLFYLTIRGTIHQENEVVGHYGGHRMGVIGSYIWMLGM